MAASVLVDTGFLVALVNRRDTNFGWATSTAKRYPPSWQTCDAVLSETFFLLGSEGRQPLSILMRSGALVSHHASAGIEDVLSLMDKYADAPMSFADGCLVRMTEVLPDPVLLTTDSDFRIYRRLGRKTVPAIRPA
jgi:uncharacterized protein